MKPPKPNAKRRRSLSRLSLGAWAAFIVAASLLPQAHGPAGVLLFQGADKIAHGLAYAVLAGLLVWNAAGLPWRARLVVAGGGAALFGLILEFAQPLTGRSADVRDLGADVVGILAALAVVALAAQARRRADRTPRHAA